MKKTFLLLFFILLAALPMAASPTLPVVSNGTDITWYYIQFVSGGSYVTDQGEAQQCLTGGYSTSSDTQLWKIEGDETNGYTFTNKAGRTLYVDKAQKTSDSTGFFYAAASPSSNTKFQLVETADGSNWLIAPQANTSIFMNQYQGAGEGKKLALWTGTDDAGSAVTFALQQNSDPDAPHLIPYPKSLTLGEGTLPLSQLTAITYTGDENKQMAEDFAAQLKKTSGIQLAVQAAGSSRTANTISMIAGATLPDEGYEFVSDAQGICIQASSHAGFFYGLQTLKQLLPSAFFGNVLSTDAAWQVRYMTIADEPQFGHRGFMLDIARHFFDKREVMRVLDILSFYKLNRFHWHLTDDQGWRIEVPGWPKLTEVGAVRSGSFTNAGGSSNFYDDTEYGVGCFYTVEDLKEVVAYAQERGIEIIPEIDLPGHMVAAVASYPELGCHPNSPSEVRINGGISQDVLNIGKDETIQFLKDVLSTVAETFPYKYIHIGGDECPTTQWSTNEDCLKRVEDEGLSGVEELQSWLVEELGVWLKDTYGKDIIVWDELLSNWKTTNTVKPVIMAWNNNGQPCVTAANKGFSSIMVPYSTLYLDFMQVSVSDARTDELYQGGWGDGYVNTVPEVYNYNPLSYLSARPEYVLGVQGNLWTETCCSDVQLEYQLLPRLLALAETGWLPAADKGVAGFLDRMQYHAAILDSLGYTYAKHYFWEEDKTEAQQAIADAEYLLTNTQPGKVGYVEQSTYDNLSAALEALKANEENATLLAALQQSVSDFKAADIVQPQTDKLYQITSASTYYKALYNGSTVYEKDGSARFHYTPQLEPEEIWQFQTSGAGYVIKNYTSGNTLGINTYNSNATVNAAASTIIRIDKPSVTVEEYDYIPGAVMISANTGYTALATGNVKRMFADCTGYVKSYNQPTLCYPGTWRITEITDFTLWLERLVEKCTNIVEKDYANSYDQPSEAALDFLQTSIIAPAQSELAAGSISEAVYKEYVALYNEYLAMPTKSLLEQLDEAYYYTIQNVYFSSYYAKASSSNVVPATWSDDNAYYWQLVKSDDGKSVKLINKGTGTAARISSYADAQKIALGTESNATQWKLALNETTEASGIVIGNGTYSWYANPSAFTTLILKPISWGGSMWNFNKTSQVVTGISNATIADEQPSAYYDLTGRRVSHPVAGGIYITAKGKKIIMR